MLRKIVKSIPAAALIALPLAAVPAIAKDDALQMVSIDVEAGGGTLFVTPEGKSLLIDTGNPEVSTLTGDTPSSARIEKAARALGVKKIDYLITTHYHNDHIGGLEGLLARMPIGTFIDHGPNRETIAQGGGEIDVNNPPPGSTAFHHRNYKRLIGKSKYIAAKAGDVFRIGSMTVTIVMADSQPLPKPLPGAGGDNPFCAGVENVPAKSPDENASSTASLISYGKAKIAVFGDLTWNMENKLFCPIDRVGKVDVYLVTHHGNASSGSPAAVNAMAPVVAIMGNSARKGDNPERAKTITASSRLQAMWRLHLSTNNPEIAGDPQMIANPDADQTKDKFHALRLRIKQDGEVTVINERNGFNKTYQAK